MRNLIGLAIVSGLSGAAASGETLSHLETAARMNVAENLCSMTFSGGANPGGVVHHTMMAAAELGVSIETAARMADARHAEIVAYLNRSHALDEFCQNARRGQL